MQNLEKWQAISLISRLTAMIVGLTQSFIIIRILDPSEWGIIQIGVAWGAAFGIYQHLGLASGTTREISISKNKSDIFKIFITATSIRYLVTIPIAAFLFFTAQKVATTQYSQEALVFPIKIYAFIILVLGIKSLLNSVVAGTKRFKEMFIFQVAITFVSISLFLPLVYLYRINGFFIARLIFEIIGMVVLAVIAFKPLRNNLSLPSKQDFVNLLKQLFSLLFAVYIVKVIITQWENSGTLLLGRDVSPETLAIFAFAFLFSKKLMHVSDAVTDVNLPILSDKYVNNVREFKSLFSTNLNKVFAFMVFSAFSAIYWTRELVYIFVGPNSPYERAFPLILPLVFTFIFYGISNIVKSSIFIPAKFIKELIASYVLMFLTTAGLYFVLTRYFVEGHVFSITLSMLAGSFTGLVLLVIFSQAKLKYKYFTHDHVLLLVLALIVSLSKDIDSLVVKFPAYLGFVTLFIGALLGAKFITKEDITSISGKILGYVKR